MGQVLSVPMVKKHAVALAKGYRPISVPERQRRAEGKELETQVFGKIDTLESVRTIATW